VRIGVDLGGTKIEAIALDPSGATRSRRRVQSPRGDYEATVRAVVDLVGEVEREAGGGAERVGVGIPGIVSPRTGLVKNANSTWLNGRPLDRDLAEAFGREIRVENDANCLALSEGIDGAAAGARVVFGVILGTGTGGGVVVDGRVVTGANAIAGEWGHNALPWPEDDERPGAACYCGRRGCIETFLSGPGLALDHESRGRERLAPESIFERADRDLSCATTVARYEARLAKSLASVVNVLDPNVIVLGGGLSNVSRLYSNVPKLWARWIFSDTIDTRLVPPRHGDSSGVRGAALLARTP
jgi:fructokinase